MTTIDRTTTIGGSDVAAILGLSPWRSPLDVWREKALGEADDRDTPAMRAGVRFEPVILGRYLTTNDRWRATASPEPIVKGWRRASPDAIVSADGWQRLVEIKTTREPWTDGIPVYYQVQAFWYLDLLDLEEVDFPVLTWPHETRDLLGLAPDEIVERLGVTVHTMFFDATAAAKIREQVTRFWETNVLGKVPPEPRDVADARRLVYATKGKTIDATTDLLELVEQREALKAEAAAAEERLDANELAIRAKMGDAEVALGFLTGKPIVSAKVTQRAAYTANVKATSYRRLDISKNWRNL